jgi:formate dehydrogenase alpha subunit
MVTLTIDGKQVTVEEGTTILKAAEKLGIEIPTFCYHDKLEAVGACRMCLVEVEKIEKLQVACATTVTEGMVVRTNTPKVKAARKGVLEFLLINHPLDCPVCDKGGECELQNLVFKYGTDKSRYTEEKRRFVVDAKSRYDDLSVGSQVTRNMNRCILCRKCVRFLNEIAAETDLGTFGRASKSEINILPDIPVDNPYSGNTVEICPVGALTSKSFRYKVRVWELLATSSICSLCGDGCNIKIWSKDNKIYRITSRRNDAVDEGFLCDRGRFGFDFVDHPDRLKQPLVRNDGELTPAEWEGAVKLTATKLNKAKDQYGTDALTGIGSSGLTNEDNYLFQKFCRIALGTNNIDHRVSSKNPLPSPDLGKHRHFLGMTNSIGDIEKVKLLFVFGCDLEKEHPIINLRAIKSVRKGNSLFLANPASTRLNRLAQDELVYQKGSEGAVLNSLLHELGDRGQGPADSDKTTGIAAEKIANLARNLKDAESLMVLCGKQIADHPDGAKLIGKLNDLLHLTGHQGKENRGVNILWADGNSQGALDCGILPDKLPGYVDVSDNTSRRRVEEVWQSEIPYKAGLNFKQILEAAHQGKIKVMYIAGADPVSQYPDSDYVREALKRLDFLMVQDISLTETAKLAHVVLPGTSFAEKDGTFTNIERRVQRLHRAFDPAGSCKHDWHIICMLAQMMGNDFNYTSSAQVFDEMVKVSPVLSGLSWRELGETGKQWKVV